MKQVDVSQALREGAEMCGFASGVGASVQDFVASCMGVQFVQLRERPRFAGLLAYLTDTSFGHDHFANQYSPLPVGNPETIRGFIVRLTATKKHRIATL